MRNAIASSLSALAIADVGGNLEYVSEAFARLWGYDSPQQIVGKHLTQLWQSPRESFIITESVLKDGIWQGELAAVRKDGKAFDARVSATLVVSERGEPNGMFASFIDVSELKRSQRKLQPLYDKEKRLRQAREGEVSTRVEFNQALVHELKTPVTAILASSELLTDELPEGPLLSLATNIRQSIADLDRKIGQLLDAARGDLGMLKLGCQEVDSLAMLRSIVVEIGAAVSSRQQSFVVELPSSLPFVWVDEGRLRGVILNLLDNAIKFTPRGGTIALHASATDDSLTVEVSDTGPGVAEKDRHRIFEPYYRGEIDRHKSVGLGLGLALSKMGVELHGGRIWSKSRRGKGSTFGFSIPLSAHAD